MCENMNKKHIDLLTEWLISENDSYWFNLNDTSISKRDEKFCADFFGKPEIDIKKIRFLFNEAVANNNELELDLMLMLIEHFDVSTKLDDIIAPLLIQPWHHFHDRIASILANSRNENIIELLYLGALYQCDNLNYESDYREFGRKCIYALLNIGTYEAIEKIKSIYNNQDKTISKHAKKILLDNQINYIKEKALLLASADLQKGNLADALGDYITEDIANDWIFEDKAMLEEMQSLGIISCKVTELYNEIMQNFESVSAGQPMFDASVWTLDSLVSHPFWIKQRALAKALVAELNLIDLV